MPAAFDPYREALVIETDTVWPEGLAAQGPADKARVEESLHADPRSCEKIEYVRQHTGFCRVITLTPEDLQRVRGA